MCFCVNVLGPYRCFQWGCTGLSSFLPAVLGLPAAPHQGSWEPGALNLLPGESAALPPWASLPVSLMMNGVKHLVKDTIFLKCLFEPFVYFSGFLLFLFVMNWQGFALFAFEFCILGASSMKYAFWILALCSLSSLTWRMLWKGFSHLPPTHLPTETLPPKTGTATPVLLWS